MVQFWWGGQERGGGVLEDTQVLDIPYIVLCCLLGIFIHSFFRKKKETIMATINYKGFRNNHVYPRPWPSEQEPSTSLQYAKWMMCGQETFFHPICVRLLTMVVNHAPIIHMHIYPPSSHHVAIICRIQLFFLFIML